jgi:hypothetical protein
MMAVQQFRAEFLYETYSMSHIMVSLISDSIHRPAYEWIYRAIGDDGNMNEIGELMSKPRSKKVQAPGDHKKKVCSVQA